MLADPIASVTFLIRTMESSIPSPGPLWLPGPRGTEGPGPALARTPAADKGRQFVVPGLRSDRLNCVSSGQENGDQILDGVSTVVDFAVCFGLQCLESELAVWCAYGV